MTKELESGKHWSLKILSRNALEEDIRGFVEDAQNLTGQGERANVDAVLQVSVSANYKLYEEMKRRYPEMCEAMRRLMQDEIADEVREAQRDGEMKKAKETAITLASMGMPAEKIAEAVKVSLKMVEEWIAGSVPCRGLK